MKEIQINFGTLTIICHRVWKTHAHFFLYELAVAKVELIHIIGN